MVPLEQADNFRSGRDEGGAALDLKLWLVEAFASLCGARALAVGERHYSADGLNSDLPPAARRERDLAVIADRSVRRPRVAQRAW